MFTEDLGLLTNEELDRLRDYKYRYVLMADGFTPMQARRLCFTRWMYLQGMIS